VRGDGILIIISIFVSSITTVQNSIVECIVQLPSTPNVIPNVIVVEMYESF